MSNFSLCYVRVGQVSLSKQKTNEQTQGSFTVFNVDVVENATVYRNGVFENRLSYHRLERVIGGNVTECDIKPGMNINAYIDVDGYLFKDPQSGETKVVNRLKITGWQLS